MREWKNLFPIPNVYDESYQTQERWMILMVTWFGKAWALAREKNEPELERVCLAGMEQYGDPIHMQAYIMAAGEMVVGIMWLDGAEDAGIIS